MKYYEILDRQRAFFAVGNTLEIQFRIDALKKLKSTIKQYENEVLEALKEDLNKAAFEAYMTEIGMIYEEINHAVRNIRKWCRPVRVGTPVAQLKSSSYIMKEPFGVILVMSPWNYPFQLALAPVIGAVSAGNCVVVKPSEYSPATSAILAKIVGSCFDNGHVAVVEGDKETSQELLKQKFDYIFFTGSVNVGRTVMEAASKHLTPVTLELGGKSPCIVDRDVNIDIAARRIIWGKTVNSGQTCVAPDYLLVHKEVKDPLLAAMKKAIHDFHSEDACQNNEFPRIINEKHFNRLTELIKTGEIVTGGSSNPATLQISPTILNNVKWDDPIMQEEIFGPILPVIEFDKIGQVIEGVNKRPKPLALYLFTRNKDIEKQVLNRISYGGGCINDTIVHLANSGMPFGGVGESGMGGYHGKWSFDTFSHKKSILKKSFRIDLKMRYAPYGDKLGMLRKFIH